MTGDAAIIEKILQPLDGALTQDAASALANFKVSDSVRERVSYLAERANEGELTPEERIEYETHIRYANVLTAIKAKARVALKNHG